MEAVFNSKIEAKIGENPPLWNAMDISTYHPGKL